MQVLYLVLVTVQRSVSIVSTPRCNTVTHWVTQSPVPIFLYAFAVYNQLAINYPSPGPLAGCDSINSAVRTDQTPLQHRESHQKWLQLGCCQHTTCRQSFAVTIHFTVYHNSPMFSKEYNCVCVLGITNLLHHRRIMHFCLTKPVPCRLFRVLIHTHRVRGKVATLN